MSDAEEFLANRGGPPSLSFGDRVNYYRWANVWMGGTVIAEPVLRRQLDPKHKTPQSWPSGEPRMKMVVTVQVEPGPQRMPDGTVIEVHDPRNPGDPRDQGHRRIFVQGYMVDAVGKAVQDAQARGIHPGGRIFVAWTDEKASTDPTHSPAKLYQAYYIPPAVAVPQGSTPPSTGLASQSGAPSPFGQLGQQVVAQDQQAAGQLVAAAQQAGYPGPAYQPPPATWQQPQQPPAAQAPTVPPFGGQPQQAPAGTPFGQQGPPPQASVGSPFGGQQPQQPAQNPYAQTADPQPPAGFQSPFGQRQG